MTRQQMGADLWSAYTELRNAQSRYDNPFFDPEFAAIISEVRDDTRFGIAFQGEDVVGVWPLHLRPGCWARPIGGPFSDVNGPILKQGINLAEETFLAGLGLAGLTSAGLLPQKTGRARPELEREGLHLSDLSGGWEAFMAGQQKAWPKHFKKMRRLYRNVDRDFSESRFEWDETSDACFETLIDLKRRQFDRTGLHDVLKPAWAQSFLDRLRQHESDRMRLRMVALRFDDRIAAIEVNLQSDRVLHGWLTAFDPELSNYSPGNMLVQEMLQHMPQGDLSLYDAGIGLSHYKRHYCNLQQPLDVGTVRADVAAASPMRWAGQLWRLGERSMPGRLGNAMTRVRRRMDQIASSELTTGRRVAGLASALNRRNV
ncbi:MAG: GNAT family N-acetyltransferase [Pseudomonadota bacterium]